MPLLFWGGLVLSLGAVAWGLFMVPPDRLMGETVRILFIHVPPPGWAWAGWPGSRFPAMLLIWKHPLAAIAARAIAVPGMVFCAICLATGSIWGRPTWGTWWVWDGRLTSMLVLLFLYSATSPCPSARRAKAARARSPRSSGWSARSMCRSSTAAWCGGTRCTSRPASPRARARSRRCSCGRCWSHGGLLAAVRRRVLMRMRALTRRDAGRGAPAPQALDDDAPRPRLSLRWSRRDARRT
jgi:heme exporter protein C